MSEISEQQKRVLLRNNLDYEMELTNTMWGNVNINPDLKEKLTQKYGYLNAEGNLIVKNESLWSLLGFYTRDLRLGNLSSINGEIKYCQYYLDLANDYLQAQMVPPFLICLSRVATVLELSQSKGGFFRRRSNTMTQENIQAGGEPEKKSLLGKKKIE